MIAPFVSSGRWPLDVFCSPVSHNHSETTRSHTRPKPRPPGILRERPGAVIVNPDEYNGLNRSDPANLPIEDDDLDLLSLQSYLSEVHHQPAWFDD